MSERIVTVLDQIEAQQQPQSIPEDISALALLQMVYRGAVKVSAQQMRVPQLLRAAKLFLAQTAY
jgi:hypothetical protein